MRFHSLFLCAAFLFAFHHLNAADSELRVQRTWMPDAHPGSFAVGFPGGLNVCFDPVRALVVYAWEGDFVDLKPTVDGKFPRNAVIGGEIFHRADEATGFSFSETAGEAEIRFRGYRIRKNTPEFFFEIGGKTVHLTISTSSDGTELQQNFRVESWPVGLAYSSGSPVPLEVLRGNPNRNADGLTFADGSAVEFCEILTIDAP